MRPDALLLGMMLVFLVALPLRSASSAEPAGPPQEELERLSRLPGQPSRLEAAGVKRGGLTLPTLESTTPLDAKPIRVALVGGLDGDSRSVRAVLGALEWFKSSAPASVRRQVTLSALPCGNPEGLKKGSAENDAGGRPDTGYPPRDGFFTDPKNPETRYIWRWATFQAPDILIEVRGGEGELQFRWEDQNPAAFIPPTLAFAATVGVNGLGRFLGATAHVRAEDGPALLRHLLAEKGRLVRSPLHTALIARMHRDPLEVAKILATNYPRVPEIAYIQAVTWSSTVRLSELTGEPRWREQVERQLTPYLKAAPPELKGSPGEMTVLLAGHIGFAELAAATGNAEAKRLTLRAAEAYRPEKPDGIARYGLYWCEDMFMKATLLGRAARLANDPTCNDLSARTIREYAGKLQYPSGLFHHALDGPICWGRGNGFAAMGLMEALTYLPKDHPDRKALVTACRKQMAALRPLRTPEGTLRQIVDHPESYREITATAMNLAALARGVRLGWLGKEYIPEIRRAWSGLSARIADDGTLTDVCVGTGAAPDLRAYYDRPGASGYDDRGGAMSLLAAVEVAALERKER